MTRGADRQSACGPTAPVGAAVPQQARADRRSHGCLRHIAHGIAGNVSRAGARRAAVRGRTTPGVRPARAVDTVAAMEGQYPSPPLALLTLPFALGVSDLGTTTIERLPIKVLSVDEITPTIENIANSRYAFVMTLGFVWREGTPFQSPLALS